MPSPPEPDVVSPEDVSIPVDGRAPLKGWHWHRPGPRGVLVVAHGLGEHSGLYRSLAEFLVPTLGVDVLAFDFLGHGRSPGRRGHLERYEQLLDDLLASTRWVARIRPGVPRFVLGHSNGGVVSILSLLREPDAADGLILSNPALRLKYQPPRHKLIAGHVLRVLAPWVTLSGPLPTGDLSRDPLQQVLIRGDHLMHNRLGPPLFFGMRAGGISALQHAPRMTTPLLVVVGDDDPIIEPDSGRSFHDRYGAEDKALRSEPGFVHAPLFDLGRGAIYGCLADWLRPRLSLSRDDVQFQSDGHPPSHGPDQPDRTIRGTMNR
ncbi:alpha/beta hydrolase [Tautonia plasticadhaerens]|uniref:Phospholipase YtpA n=1 Tax=Tautonia plasticadhaerens TaxID=2527974 RepID=A0A518GY71_9BACT|nr:alpha/beta hydrolase [Tautonia plasticadhaerens]QDV33513.1 Phospholipase YtpA [Tautonia plasticadhaerens]